MYIYMSVYHAYRRVYVYRYRYLWNAFGHDFRNDPAKFSADNDNSSVRLIQFYRNAQC